MTVRDLFTFDAAILAFQFQVFLSPRSEVSLEVTFKHDLWIVVVMVRRFGCVIPDVRQINIVDDSLLADGSVGKIGGIS